MRKMSLILSRVSRLRLCCRLVPAHGAPAGLVVFPLVLAWALFAPLFLSPVPPALAAPATEIPAAPEPAGEQPDAAASSSGSFGFADVEKKARELADGPHAVPDPQLPDFLRGLGAEQWDRIRFKPEKALWKERGMPFEARFFHPGFIFTRTVGVNVVAEGKSEKQIFTPDMFDFGPDFPVDRVKQHPLDFAGFRLLSFLPGSDKVEVASFLGATYFRSMGKNAAYGIYARGLTVNTALPVGEEFPYFREFWLVQPEPGAESFTVYALMDSPSMTGAYSFLITPGASVTMDVECRLFMRKNAERPQKIGVAPLTSMFFYAETTGGNPDSYRPEVHNSDGLLFHSEADGWAWSPLSNPARLAVNTFVMRNPRGFGLLQRDDNFDHYQDIAARYDRRSSLWVEPKGDWGSGHLELIEIPTRDEIHNNIDAFWVPARPDARDGNADGAAGNGEAPPYPADMAFGYRLYWMAPGVTPHELGRAAATRVVRSPQDDVVCFLIDFEGEALKFLPADTGLTSVIETPEQSPVLEKQLMKNPVTGGWRLSFKVRVPRQEGMVQTLISARDGSPRLRFRALLKKGENLPDPLTEVWIYDMPS
jgi:glucans biosynthesis protein